jgi:hypothetical protein
MTSLFQLINFNKFGDYNIFDFVLNFMMVLSILRDIICNIICYVVNLDPAIFSVFRAIQLLLAIASSSVCQGRDQSSLLRKGSAIFFTASVHDLHGHSYSIGETKCVNKQRLSIFSLLKWSKRYGF